MSYNHKVNTQENAIDCYGIPGSKRLLGTVLSKAVPPAYTVYRVIDDYGTGTENAVIFTVQSMVWQRTKPRLQLVIRILDPIDQYTTHSL